MLQFYFLSIILNALGGYILIRDDDKGVLELKSNLISGFSLNDSTFRLILGILTAIMGLFKILSPIEGDVLILGDLLIAVAGFLCGFILIYEYYRSRTTVDDSENSEKLSRVLVRNKKIVGIIAIVSAVLHFCFRRCYYFKSKY